MAIYVYNRAIESHQQHPNNYPIFRGGGVLGNPYTHKKLEKTKAIYQVKSRDEAISCYERYFDVMYQSNIKFKAVVDEIYEKYKNGEDIFLECYCKKYQSNDIFEHLDEVRCHGDIIKERLERRLLRERFRELRKNDRDRIQTKCRDIGTSSSD